MSGVVYNFCLTKASDVEVEIEVVLGQVAWWQA